MAPSLNRRSTSFHVLPRESSGDGEILPSLPDDNIIATAGAHPRRRRRNKGRKRNLSQPSALGLGLHMLEEEGIADGAGSSVFTSNESMISPIDQPLRQNSFGSQQWDMVPSPSCNSDSIAMLSCTSIIPSNYSPPLSHNVKELANGNHAAHSNGMQEFLRQGLYSDAQKGRSMGNGKVTPQSKEENLVDYQVSDVFVQRLSKQDDRPAEQSEIVENSSSFSNGADYAALLSSTRHHTLSNRNDDTHTVSFVKDDVVSPGVIPDLQVFVGDGSSVLSSQLTRAELRQRIVHNQADHSTHPVSHHKEEASVEGKDFGASNNTTVSECGALSEIRESQDAAPGHQTPERPTHIPVMHTETPHLLDWQQLMSENSLCAQPAMASPFEYFLGEVFRPPSALLETQSAETDKKRQHVYNTMFHVPWRCELLIVIGFFVCLDSFLSLLTVMPVRIVVLAAGFISRKRQFRRLRADELSDLFSLLVLMAGVTLLQQADISYIYHMIRSQATIKLYVVYNVLEIFDKLCQSFGSDVLQVVLNSAENVATCPSASLMPEAFRFAFDQCIGIVSFVFHSLIILAQSITVSAAIRSHNNALLTLLISNNFAEIKSNVFKRLAKDNLHKLAYLDTVERFHIVAHLFFVLAQNLLAANEPWLHAFACNAGMVFVCEIVVDVIKHAFLAKFNEIKPAAYSEFLLALCKQTLTSQSRELHKTMSFAPFAPACVVIRVLIPLYAAYLPDALVWRLSVMLLFITLTFVFLVAVKILVALGLLKHANWYVARHNKREKLLHFD